ncbi:MAG: hypothetical protein ABI113_01960, partial [Mucilaginibacter sp.]
VNAQAQKAIVFKMKYLPNHAYAMATGMTMKFDVNLSGNEDIIEKLKTQGITQPMKATMVMSLSGNTKTGQTAADEVFPMTVTYKLDSMSVKIADKDIPMPPKLNTSTTIYGHAGKEGRFKADSISGNKMKDTSEKKITQMMNAIQNKIKFPEKPLHIGDSFTQEMPVNIPIAEGEGNTNINVTYKLVSIDNGIANFDIVQNADIQLNVKGVTLKITGTGTGKLVYSIKNSFPIDYKTTLNLAIDGNISNMVIKGTAVLDGDYKYTVN